MDVRVVPKSSKSRVSIQPDYIKVWVKAPPDKGAANLEVLSLFKTLDAKARIILGHKSRRKKISLPSINECDVHEQLKRLLD